IDYIEAALALLVPIARETFLHALSECFIFVCPFSQFRREPRHRMKGVEPQRVDLHRLAYTRCNRAIANFCVHPRNLASGLSCAKQPVGRIHVNAITRSAHVPIDGGGKYLENFSND